MANEGSEGRSFASVAVEKEELRAAYNCSPEEVLPGDLLNVDLNHGLSWVVVLPTEMSTDMVPSASAMIQQTDSPLWHWTMDQFGNTDAIGSPQIVLHVPRVFSGDAESTQRLKRAELTSAELQRFVLQVETAEREPENLSNFASEETLTARTELAAQLREVLRAITGKIKQFRPALFAMIGDSKSSLLRNSEVDVVRLARRLERLAPTIHGEGSSGIATRVDASVLGLHDLLMSLQHFFIWTARPEAFRHSHVFTIRPQREREIHATVMSWFELAARRERNPLDAFIAHAGRSLASGEKPAWGRSDLRILCFLVDSLTVSFYSQGSLYDGCVAYILSRLGRIDKIEPDIYRGTGANKAATDLNWRAAPYEGRHETVARLLDDLKVFGDGDFMDWSLASGPHRRFIERVVNRKRMAGMRTLGALREVDLDAELREDYHGTVYVIDEPDAHELDDGISVETSGLDNGKCWLRVHIADPTAYLMPNDPQALDASEQAVTLYFRSSRIPMLPDGLFPGMGSRQEQAVGGGKNDPLPSLTFSALVNAEGEVEKTKVEVHRVYNIHITSYEAVDKIISEDEKDQSKAARDLRLMRDVGRRLRNARVRNGAFEVSGRNTQAVFNDATVHLPLVPPSSLSILSPRTFLTYLNNGRDVDTVDWDAPMQHDPKLSFEVSREDKMTISSEKATGMVAECMILACKIAADFLWRQHRVAGPFRTQSFPGSVEAKWKQIIRDLAAKSQPLDLKDLYSAGINLPPASYSATPGEHVTIGVGGPELGDELAEGGSLLLRNSGYCRATSPLRRYEDLVTHWQIKGVLHRERFGGRTRRWPPCPRIWSIEEMREMLPKIQRDSELATSLLKQSTRYWLHRALRQTLNDSKRCLEDGVQDGSASSGDDAAGLPSSAPEQSPSSEKWHRVTPRELFEPMPAMVVRPTVSIFEPTMRCTVRVSLPTLGGLQANCLWPVETEVTADGIERAVGTPWTGQMLKVKVGWGKEKVYGGGEIRVELAE